MDKIVSVLVLIIGILLILPLLTIAIGTADKWIIAVIVLILGIWGLVGKKK